jgi:hypothetical protein
MGPEESNIGRRNFLQMTGAGIVAVSAGAAATQAVASNQLADSESLGGIAPQPAPQFPPDLTTADIMVETLISWGATHCFGLVGDGINSIIEALRKRQDRIKYIDVRHEEAAAFMASGFAKHTGQLGVCVGTTGPGAVHLLNGLYDAHMDGAPVVAITGMTFHDLIGTRYQQGRRSDEVDAGCCSLQCRSDGAGTRGAGDQPRLSRGAWGSRGRSSDRVEGHADDAACGGQALDGQSGRANIVLVDACRQPAP